MLINHVQLGNITVHNPRRTTREIKPFTTMLAEAWRLRSKRNSLIKIYLTLCLLHMELTSVNKLLAVNEHRNLQTNRNFFI